MDDGAPRFFNVVKVHHERTWLRQKRVLVVTGDEVMKAHGDGVHGPGDWPADPHDLNPTKVHTLDSLVAIVLSSRSAFTLQFRGDHPYFYHSDDATDIASILQRRFAALVAARVLSPHDPQGALAALRDGRLQMPQETDVSRLHVEKLDLIQSLRAGALDGAGGVGTLRVDHEAMIGQEVPDPRQVLASFRACLDSMEESFAHQLLTRERTMYSKLCGKAEGRKLPKFADEDDVVTCVEEALQSMIFTKQVFSVLWNATASAFASEQERVDVNIHNLSMRPVGYFGIHRDFELVKFDLVRHYLSQLEKCFTPSAMLDVIFVSIKCIVVCVEAHFDGLASSPTDGEGDDAAAPAMQQQRTSEEYTADDVLPMLIYIIVCGAVKNLAVARRFIEAMGRSESTERAYYFTVFASAVQFLLDAGSASPVEDTVTTLSTARTDSAHHSPFSTPRLVRDNTTTSVPCPS